MKNSLDTNHKKLLAFYQDCYEADTRTISLSNIFSSKVENRHFFQGKDELLGELLPRIPLETSIAESILKNIDTYSKEKSLYLCAFFVLGKNRNTGKRVNNICAPLFFYPAEIDVQDGLFFLSINKTLAFPNIPFLESHRIDNTVEIAELFKETLAQPMTFASCGSLKRTLESNFPQFDSEELLLFPGYVPESRLKSYLKKVKEGFKVFPATALGVFRHSTATLGIITELKELQQGKKLSPALRNFFDYDLVETGDQPVTGIYVPAILSKSQKQIIESANKYDETVVVGPPGTGKSFTISTLAIDQVNRGNSVLVVSKTDQALNVIDHKIEQEIGIAGLTVRAGRRQYLKNLKDRIKNILLGLPAVYALGLDRSNEFKGKIARDRSTLSGLQSKLYDQVEDDLRWGEYLFKNKKGGIISSIVKKYIEWLNGLQEPHWDIITNYYAIKDEYLHDLKEYVMANFQYRLWRTSKDHRRMLRNFSQALRARTLDKQEELFSQLDFKILLKTFPVWICKLSDLFEVLPLQEELFDVVIIDEASQCDISSCLPALQRAKKVVIVGDPKQLRHYSFLSRGMIRHLRNKHDLSHHPYDRYFDYRDASILDIYFEKISNVDQVIFLDEHFRGNDSLIGFSNEHFYNGRLKIMKSLPQHDAIGGLHHITIKGERSKEGTNELEAEELLKKVEMIIKEQNDLDHTAATTLGILSPFRNQAELLENLVHDTFSNEHIEKHAIKVGTPYGFQGDERDIMFISFCLDDNTHTTALHYLNQHEMFNVAITRAKFTQYIFSSISIATGDHLIHQYLLSINTSKKGGTQPSNTIHDEFLKEVVHVFNHNTNEIYTDYLVAGILIDVLLHTPKGYFGIDLVGYPGKFFEANSMEQYEILGRAGVKMIPLPYSNWYYEREKCIEGLNRIIFEVTDASLD